MPVATSGAAYEKNASPAPTVSMTLFVKAAGVELLPFSMAITPFLPLVTITYGHQLSHAHVFGLSPGGVTILYSQTKLGLINTNKVSLGVFRYKVKLISMLVCAFTAKNFDFSTNKSTIGFVISP